MRKNFGFALAFLLAIVSNGATLAQTQPPEEKIWILLDDSEAAYASLGEAEFRGLGTRRRSSAHAVSRHGALSRFAAIVVFVCSTVVPPIMLSWASRVAVWRPGTGGKNAIGRGQ